MAEIESQIENEAYQVFIGTVSPKFENIDAVKKADHEVVLTLFTELQEFNKVDERFLSRLKNLSSQAQRPPVRSPPSTPPASPLPATTSSQP